MSIPLLAELNEAGRLTVTHLADADRYYSELFDTWKAAEARADAAERALRDRNDQRDDDEMGALLQSALEEQDSLRQQATKAAETSAEQQAIARSWYEEAQRLSKEHKQREAELEKNVTETAAKHTEVEELLTSWHQAALRARERNTRLAEARDAAKKLAAELEEKVIEGAAKHKKTDELLKSWHQEALRVRALNKTLQDVRDADKQSAADRDLQHSREMQRIRASHQAELATLQQRNAEALRKMKTERDQQIQQLRDSRFEAASLKNSLDKKDARCRALQASLDELTIQLTRTIPTLDLEANDQILEINAASLSVSFKSPLTVRQTTRLFRIEPVTREFFGGKSCDPASCLQRLRALLHSDPLDLIGVAAPPRVEAVATAALKGGAPEAALVVTQLAWHVAPKRDSTLLELPRARAFLEALYRAVAAHAPHTRDRVPFAKTLGCDEAYMLVSLLFHALSFSPPAAVAVRNDVANWVKALEMTNLCKSKAGLIQVRHLAAACEGLQPPTIRFFNEHSNDPQSFRNVEIFPAAEELASDATPSTLPEEPDKAIALDAEACLGRHFRLAREDFLIPFREAVAEYRKWKETGSKPHARLPCCVLTGAHLSENTKLHQGSCVAKSVSFSFAGGLHVTAKPAELAKPEFFRKESKFLAEGSALALLDAGSDKVVATGHIVNRDAEALAQKTPALLVELNASGLMVSPATKLTLLVLKSVQTFSIVPPLRCLQSMTQVPLDAQLLKAQPPTPVVKAGDVLDTDSSTEKERWSAVRPVITARAHNLMVQSPAETEPRRVNVDTQNLNDSQAAALISSVTKNVTLIQGPPGTGKTHVGARVAKAVTSEPGSRLLVVCYTNHALDQLLLKLVNDYGFDTTTLKRFGGSAPEALASFACRPFRYATQRHQQCKELEAKIKAAKAATAELCAIVRNDPAVSAAGFERLGVEFLDLMVTADELQEHARCPGMHAGYLLHQWLDGKALDKTYLKTSKPRDEQGNNQLIFARRKDLFAMDHSARTAKFKEVRRAADQEMRRLLREIPVLYGDIRAVEAQAAAAALQAGRVFGCTTTFAARNLELLRELAPDTIMVEEAAEILEAQVLVTLTPSCKRLVMIGDHKQLRPKVEHTLKVSNPLTKYNLDRSLFERLIVINGFEHHQLNIQHRMFGELSAVVRNLSYPQLQDAPSVTPGKRLKGFFNEALTFVDTGSRFLEDGEGGRGGGPGVDADGSGATSKTNTGEAQFVTQVVRYMLQQDVPSKDITILSPYLGQVKLLKTLLNQALKSLRVAVGVGDRDREEDTEDDSGDENPKRHVPLRYIRVASVDNYQGEENEYVLVSLVRSNARQEIGWLREPERLNVLLSRAKRGLVLFGSRRTFSGRSGQDVWVPKVFDRLRGTGSCVTGLTLRCRVHDVEDVSGTLLQPPPDARVAHGPKDMLELAPHGGCALPCRHQLQCGHVCMFKKCHADDPGHQVQHTQCPAMVKFTCEAHGHVEAVKCRDKATHQCGLCRHLRETRERAEEEKEALEIKEQRAAQQFEVNRRRKEEEHAAEAAKMQQDLREKQREDEAELDYTNRMAQLQAKAAAAQARHEADMAAREAELEAKTERIRQEQVAAKAVAVQKAAEAEAQVKAQQAAATKDLEKAEAQAAAAAAKLQREVDERKARNAEAKRRIEARKEYLCQQLREAGSDPTVGVDDKVECEICFGAFPRYTMAACSGPEPHLLCTDCFGKSVTTDARTPEERLASAPHGVPCVMCPKDATNPAGVFTDTVVQLFASPAAFQSFQRAEKAAAELEGKKAAIAEHERELALGEAQKHVRHIENKILTLCCPHCTKAFVDFDNCCAVQCTCKKYFCAWCLEGSDRDNHRHVANCAENPMPGKEVFGNLAAFNEHHAVRKKRLTERYIEENVRDAALAAKVRERVAAMAP